MLGVDPGPIGRYPFDPVFTAPQTGLANELGFQVHPDAELETLALISGFLGCNILAAAVATRLDEAAQGTLLADLGTNGELFLKAENAIYATSCATGPAFEGGNIRHGMQALPGAINRVVYDPDQDAVGLSIIQGHGDLFQLAVGICGAGFMRPWRPLCETELSSPTGRLIRNAAAAT